jgi:hypothetical protein
VVSYNSQSNVMPVLFCSRLMVAVTRKRTKNEERRTKNEERKTKTKRGDDEVACRSSSEWSTRRREEWEEERRINTLDILGR